MPARGTTTIIAAPGFSHQFQSTCPHGARLAYRGTANAYLGFQSTCPHGARPTVPASALTSSRFNPRARTGHDIGCFHGSFGCRVSIHVPARGTTTYARYFVPSSFRFQSTCPHGARHDQQPDHNASGVVSIHVPARGTTYAGNGESRRDLLFQSTCPHGARLVVALSWLVHGLFQSTCPHGARPIAKPFTPQSRSFNPRARTGHDTSRPRGGFLGGVSIHVPARGTTAAIDVLATETPVSIHVPARGTTFPSKSNSESASVSIHVPARGTTFLVTTRIATRGFQSTCPHGARQEVKKRRNERNRFQSTCPHGARRLSSDTRIPAKRVSIHVPARGTTRMMGRGGFMGLFQSTCPHGARRVLLDELSTYKHVSIHVPARGTTSAPSRYTLANGYCFNPRARTGHDMKTRCLTAQSVVSIHVPARGTTPAL